MGAFVELEEDILQRARCSIRRELKFMAWLLTLPALLSTWRTFFH
jgi:hypothetical protein